MAIGAMKTILFADAKYFSNQAACAKCADTEVSEGHWAVDEEGGSCV
jgi:hypothetical protein